MADVNNALADTGPVAPVPGPMTEIGFSGLRASSGYVFEELLSTLQGDRGRKIYREMADNDATVGAILSAITLTLRGVSWRAEPHKGDEKSQEAQNYAEFAGSLLDDMSHTWPDFITECLTMTAYGWSWHEAVYKRRGGPDQTDPTQRSKYDDGYIGIRKLAPRGQDALDRWDLQDDGGINGMFQNPPYQTPANVGRGVIYLPIERSLLFRTTSFRNNPEGRSLLRNAYRSWYKLKYIEDYEAIGIERELAGLPVVSIPARYLAPGASEVDRGIADQFAKLARDLRVNEQSGVVIPSDTHLNKDGSPSSERLVDIKLLSSGGSRQIDTASTVQRYQRGIARSVMADFLMLGEGGGTTRGSYGMHDSKASLFGRSLYALLAQITDPLNRYQLPRVWALNGFDQRLMPYYMPGQVASTDLEELADFVSKMAAAGAPMFPDDNLDDFIREEARLPLRTEETKQLQEEQKQQAQDAATAGAGQEPPKPGTAPKAPRAAQQSSAGARQR
jgi:hypothetical protein